MEKISSILVLVQIVVIIIQLIFLIRFIVVENNKVKILDLEIKKAKSLVHRAYEQVERNKKQGNAVLYLCKQDICSNCTAKEKDGCHHTSNIKHAKNFNQFGSAYFEKREKLEGVDCNE